MQTPPNLEQRPVATLIVVLALLFIYFLPGFIASWRHHRNAGAIWMLTLLLGWVGIGWIVALVWAFTNNREPNIFPIYDAKYPMNDAILRRVDELQAYEARKHKGSNLGRILLYLLALVMLYAIVFAGVTKSHAGDLSPKDLYLECYVGRYAMVYSYAADNELANDEAKRICDHKFRRTPAAAADAMVEIIPIIKGIRCKLAEKDCD